MRPRLLLIAFLLFAGCDNAGQVPPTASPATQPSDEQAVLRAVFISLLTPADTHLRWTFLAFPGEADPSDEMLADLRKMNPDIEPVSAMEFDSFPQHRVHGGRGVLLRIDQVEWLGASSAVVDAASLAGNVGGQGWRLTLTKVDGEWQVSEREVTWES